MSESSSNVSLILERIKGGEDRAKKELFAAVYDELRRQAAACMARERRDHTLQATALVNEAFLKLAGHQGNGCWKSSHHFFAAAAEAMRMILVDHARKKNAGKRVGGRDHRRVSLTRAELPAEEKDPVDLEALDRALTALRAQDERRYQIVMYRYFAGLREKQIADMLGVSERTVRRDWRIAKAILLVEMFQDQRQRHT